MSSHEYVQYMTKQIIHYLEHGRKKQSNIKQPRLIRWFGLFGWMMTFWTWKRKQTKR